MALAASTALMGLKGQDGDHWTLVCSLEVGALAGGTIGVIAMKIGMYMMCRKSNNPSVQAFALDHINDVVVNAVGLFGAHAAPDALQHHGCACGVQCMS